MTTIIHAVLENTDKMLFVAKTKSGHEVRMDAYTDVGGEDAAARPAELPFAGLSGCTGIDVMSILRKMKQTVTRFEVDVEGLDHTEEYPKYWKEIRVIFTVEGKVEEEKLARAIDLSRTKYCGVSALMRPTVKIHYRYILNGSTTDMQDQ